MAVPTTLAGALALLTKANGDPLTALDIREVTQWVNNAVPDGAPAAIPNASTDTITSAESRGKRAALTNYTVQDITLDAGLRDGQTKEVQLDGSVFTRTRLLNPDGSTAAVVGGGKA